MKVSFIVIEKCLLLKEKSRGSFFFNKSSISRYLYVGGKGKTKRAFGISIVNILCEEENVSKKRK
jgi:hypothetical protein